MSLYRNPPETRFADTGQGLVGYQVVGEGPPDMFFLSNMVTNLEVMWESPQIASYFDRLSSMGRVVISEYLGIGVSDPFPYDRNPTFDDLISIVISVLDDAEIPEVTLVSDAEAGAGAILTAVSYPERVHGLVLVNSYARFLRDDDYPIGIPEEAAERVSKSVKELWGKPGFFFLTAPSSVEDERLTDWLAKYQRLVAPPTAAARFFDWFLTVDVRSILPSVNVPTLVISHQDATFHRPTFSRYLAEKIPEAKLVELPGTDTTPYFLADVDNVLDEVEEFLVGERPERVVDRTVATVMFTDIVDSTTRAAQLGDKRWMHLLAQHDRLTADYVEAFGGRLVTTTGDGVLATFDGPTRAVACAAQMRDDMPTIGLEIRAGLHTGEIELKEDGDIGGLAVHIASRVSSAAGSSEVVVSSTVKDLVAGSDITFHSLGQRSLKGVPEKWSLYELTNLPAGFRLSL